MLTLTLDEYKAAVKAQGVPHEHIAMRCPMCGTIQSAADLIAAGAGKDFDAVQKYLGFSCVGRFTGASSPRKQPDGKPCDWTLGGFFQMHKLEVVTPYSEMYPRFELATADEAKAHMAALLAVASPEVGAAP
jgi:hypothetical protein